MSQTTSNRASAALASGMLLFSAVLLSCCTGVLVLVLRENKALLTILTLLLFFFLTAFVNLILNQFALVFKKSIVLPLRINRYLSVVLFRAGSVFAKLIGKKEEYERSYIALDAELVSIKKIKIKAEEILVLLPRCLQNNGCKNNVTNNIENCVSCGKCDVKAIKEIIANAGVKASVVTGGSQARELVKKNKPKVIIAVACERELVSGIFDVPACEIIGIVNERPEGPCLNTRANISELSAAIKALIER